MLGIQKTSALAAIVFILLFAAGNFTAADVVTMKNGQVIEGATKKIGDNIEIRTRATRFFVPASSVEKIEEKPYEIQDEEDERLTEEEMRRNKANELYRQAQRELDRLNVSSAISLIEEALKTKKDFDKGREKLIHLLTRRGEFEKAKTHLDFFKEKGELPPAIAEMEERILSGFEKQRLREKRMDAAQVDEPEFPEIMKLIPTGPITRQPPAADYSGMYYIEYSYYAVIQQKGGIASVALYSQNSSMPLYQFSANVLGIYLVPDLSRIAPNLPYGSVYAVMHPEDEGYTLNYKGEIAWYLGKKIENENEAAGFRALVSKQYSEAQKRFEKAVAEKPRDGHALFGLARSLIYQGQYRRALDLLNQIPQDASFRKYLFMDKFLNISRDYALALQKKKNGENAIVDYELAIRKFPLREPNFSALGRIFDGSEGLNAISAEEAKKILEMHEESLDAVADTYQKPFAWHPMDGAIGFAEYPHHGDYMKLARLIYVSVMLSRYEERFDEALTRARRLYALGRHLNRGPFLTRQLALEIQQLAFIAFREVIKAARTPAQAESALRVVNEIHENAAPYDYEALVSCERVEWPNVDEKYYKEKAWEIRIDMAPQAMLPLAAAAKKYYLENNNLWPVSVTMLVPEYMPEYPKDPFSREPLNVFPYPGGFRIYSVGPDRDDDRGEILFDPANGPRSNGDLIMDIK